MPLLLHQGTRSYIHMFFYVYSTFFHPGTFHHSLQIWILQVLPLHSKCPSPPLAVQRSMQHMLRVQRSLPGDVAGIPP